MKTITEAPAAPRPSHTPGPWSLSASFDRVERRVKHGDNPPLVWGIASGINSAHPDYMPRAEQIANARLIASAPTLLDALAGCADALREAGKDFAQANRLAARPNLYELHEQAARAAIAKARG